jgi:hypothetical protein
MLGYFWPGMRRLSHGEVRCQRLTAVGGVSDAEPFDQHAVDGRVQSRSETAPTSHHGKGPVPLRRGRLELRCVVVQFASRHEGGRGRGRSGDRAPGMVARWGLTSFDPSHPELQTVPLPTAKFA